MTDNNEIEYTYQLPEVVFWPKVLHTIGGGHDSSMVSTLKLGLKRIALIHDQDHYVQKHGSFLLPC